MTHRSIRRTLLAAAALTAAAATATVTAQVPIHSQTDDDGARYGVWGAGADYKCSFHDGMAFVPYLGRDYPVTRSLRWRTVSAKIGATELCTVAAPRARWHDCRAEFDLGGLTEAYDLRLDGVEQTFVLATRPAAAGDLVIRGAVATALSCATRSRPTTRPTARACRRPSATPRSTAGLSRSATPT